jgi:flagellar basal-body rod modification protein FlgD
MQGLGPVTSSGAQDQFLHLLVTQLQYQNPLDPLDNYEFIAQLAQLSSLKQLESLNSSFQEILRLQQLSEGSDLLGKRVRYIDPETRHEAEGVVEAVRLVNGRLELTISGVMVPSTAIVAVLPD